ncbi:hypothetical protein HPT27_17715 [Permianibacter sp. IMCC34836]|uniref:CHASE3 domain-containing protein n=1 Tax=Permianibacter fluminis TaxID=2738515 RepID=UPI0015578B91|nr:CHASE3 domain-containing protein [Permianibacter fluminis]NQD38857.1 hypothetical protein [Permianibacter fluminis]
MVADLHRLKPLRRLLQAGLVLLVLVAMLAVYVGIRSANTTEQLNQHTEAIRIFNRLLSALQDIETGQRGFVITGYEDYLDPFNSGSEALLKVLPELARALPGQTAEIDRLQLLAEAKLEQTKATIRLRRTEGFAAAQALVMTRRGKHLMDSIRDLTSPQLNRLHDQIDSEVLQQTRYKWLLLISITSFVVLLLLLIPAAFYVWRQQLKHESLEAHRLKLTRELLTAQVDERKRISQLLHDDIAQVMAAAKIGLDGEAMRADAGQPVSAERLRNLAQMLERTLAETRTLLGELRPPLLIEMGLQAALNYELDRMRERAGNTTLGMVWQEHSNGCRFDPGTEHSLFLLVREALHNALRHAKAKHIRIEADCSQQQLRIAVQDDGIGFDVDDTRSQEGHLGMIGMRERAGSLGADIDISSRPGRGTAITLILPRTVM